MTKKEVVVIIPTLNEERFVDSCLQSIINQTFPQEKMDIIVVDGGSTDHTRQIVQKFSEEFMNIRLLDNPKRIQAAAFNLGVINSDAPYIIRLDAHALYDCNYISYCINHLSCNEKYGNVGGQCKILSPNNTLIAKANAVLNQMKFGIGGADYRVGNIEKDVDTVPFGAFRREVIEKIGFMNESLVRGEDNEYNARIRKSGFKIHFDTRIIATYFARATLVGSIKQMFANGFSIGILLHIYPSSVGIRHLIPLFFVLSLLCLIPLSFFFPLFRMLLYVELTVYFVMDLYSSIVASKRKGWENLLILPFLIFMVHISYGIGSFKGIIVKNY
ncbi:MAG: glycosyltransferase family 2 protein [Oscillibacter sp.]|nr:glycosyltransferase family 2 protein [Oscillibacter sp.]